MEGWTLRMKTLLNRRQFGKRLIAGTALALVVGETTTTGEATGQNDQNKQWQIVAPGTWKIAAGTPEPISPVTSRLVSASIEAMRHLPVVQAPVIDIPTSNISRRGVSLALPLAPH